MKKCVFFYMRATFAAIFVFSEQYINARGDVQMTHIS